MKRVYFLKLRCQLFVRIRIFTEFISLIKYYQKILIFYIRWLTRKKSYFLENFKILNLEPLKTIRLKYLN